VQSAIACRVPSSVLFWLESIPALLAQKFEIMDGKKEIFIFRNGDCKDFKVSCLQVLVSVVRSLEHYN